MEQVMLEKGATTVYEVDAETRKELVSIIKRSINGKQLNQREALMLFFWAKHQNAPQFDFVPAKYRAVEPTKKTAKKGK